MQLHFTGILYKLLHEFELLDRPEMRYNREKFYSTDKA